MTKETTGRSTLASKLRPSSSAIGAGTTKVREPRMNTLPVAGLRKAGRRESRAKRHDFYRRYDVLLANWYLLTSRIQQEILSIRQDLHDELARWRPHQPEPDWNAYADRMSMIAARTALR